VEKKKAVARGLKRFSLVQQPMRLLEWVLLHLYSASPTVVVAGGKGLGKFAMSVAAPSVGVLPLEISGFSFSFLFFEEVGVGQPMVPTEIVINQLRHYENRIRHKPSQ
jgi:hypothetical protein